MRWLYTAFYSLFLDLLSFTTWFLLVYSNTPLWIYTFFIIAYILFFVGMFITEFCINSEAADFWSASYIIFHLFGFISLTIGISLAIIYSSVSWSVWITLGIAIFLLIVSIMILTIFPKEFYISALTFIIAIVLFIAALFLGFFQFINTPWWIWLLFALTILFALLAYIFAVYIPVSTCTPITPVIKYC